MLAGPGAGAGLLGELASLVSAGGALILSGAGLSTESGIPDYRGPSGLARRAEPMTYQAFAGGSAARRRYWARSYLGWRHIARAVPNDGHRAVAELQRGGVLAGIITQNVDGLHQAAGAQQVIELHGGLDRVACLGCGQRTSRARLDRRLAAANPGWAARAAAAALVVLGSSLTVMSGYRFVRQAARLAIPIAIVNQGPTRGDAQAGLILDAPIGQTLTALVALCGVVREPGRSA